MIDMSRLSFVEQYHSNVSVYTNRTMERAITVHVTRTPESVIRGSTILPNPSIMSPPTHPLMVFWSLSNADFDIRDILEDTIQKNLEIANIETAVAQIREIVWEFPFDVENFLRNNESLVPHLIKVLSTIRGGLAITGGPIVGFALQKWSDVEVPDMEDIEVIVKVGVKDYDVLMRLWEVFDEEIYEDLPSEISKKLVVSFELL